MHIFNRCCNPRISSHHNFLHPFCCHTGTYLQKLKKNFLLNSCSCGHWLIIRVDGTTMIRMMSESKRCICGLECLSVNSLNTVNCNEPIKLLYDNNKIAVHRNLLAKLEKKYSKLVQIILHDIHSTHNALIIKVSLIS